MSTVARIFDRRQIAESLGLVEPRPVGDSWRRTTPGAADSFAFGESPRLRDLAEMKLASLREMFSRPARPRDPDVGRAIAKLAGLIVGCATVLATGFAVIGLLLVQAVRLVLH
jgi:hypothetical protein